MEITREVILDLLPLYIAGEASPATRALVEEYLRQDPQLAARVREQTVAATGRAPAGGPPPELELRSLHRTRRLLALQRWLLSLGISATLLSLSSEINFRHGRPVEAHLLMRDWPLPLGLLLALGLGCLAGYFVLRRRLRGTGM